MPPIYEGTAAPFGEPETWTEELFAATGARWPVWVLAVAVIVGLALSGHLIAAAFLAVACGVFSVLLP